MQQLRLARFVMVMRDLPVVAIINTFLLDRDTLDRQIALHRPKISLIS